MIKVRNLGRKSLEEVEHKLAMMGLSLASDDEQPAIYKEETDNARQQENSVRPPISAWRCSVSRSRISWTWAVWRPLSPAQKRSRLWLRK